MTAAFERGPGGTLLIDGKRPLCGDRADPVQSCQRPFGHDGPHQHAQRGEWLNNSPVARFCDERSANTGGPHGRCSRDVGHEGGHSDHKRGIYWQAGS
jgi:hypothetical protein